MSSRTEPFFNAVDAKQSIVALPNPFPHDGPGVVYIVRRVLKRIYRLWCKNRISTATFLHFLQIKIGHTKRFPRRCGEYRKCNKSHQILWCCYFDTSKRMLLERLVQDNLYRLGAPPIREDCGCAVNHREFVDFNAAGGIRGICRLVRRWQRRMGEVVSRTKLNKAGYPV
ncbi:hypothetical protein C8R46DRAFT_1215342 [Mycena filopes]|nr:hypothetical protein C8R46DRAFT_1215342 [Mycena filopes]